VAALRDATMKLSEELLGNPSRNSADHPDLADRDMFGKRPKPLADRSSLGCS
jgi:hypothetical protein